MHDSAGADFAHALANEGIRLREGRDLPGAEQIFHHLIERYPLLAYGWQEMGVLRALQGDADEALRLFRRAVQVAPGELLARKHLAQHLARLGRLDEAVAALRRATPIPQELHSAWKTLEQLMAFMRAHSKLWTLDQIDEYETGAEYLAADAVGARILSAIENREPFSLIRLGDGEGAWLRMGDDDEARYRHLYETNRRRILRIWFDSDRLYGNRWFGTICDRVAVAIDRADIVGIPYGLRVHHEYEACSPSGVPGCTNILRYLNARRTEAGTKRYCVQDIHRDLTLNGFLSKLLASTASFGIVTCHPQLGLRLARASGARITFAILIPEERGFANVIEGLSPITGVSGMTEPHFPTVYQRTVAKLQRLASDAAVWLIAAGYLGKIYCDIVREAGGVAIDIGSVADGWAGSVTRPYLRKIDRFKL